MVLLMALTANFAPQAGAQTIRDANHHNIGRISPNGTVRDNDSRPIGFFDRDGVIRNKTASKSDLSRVCKSTTTTMSALAISSTMAPCATARAAFWATSTAAAKSTMPTRRLLATHRACATSG